MYFQDHEDNFCNYYLLPLLKIGKKIFGERNFINSYVDRVKKMILVKVRKKEDVGFRYWEHNDFVNDYLYEDCYYIVFSIPKEFYPDMERFIKGRYSKFSARAKNLIKTYSGLDSDKKLEGQNRKISDFRILVLTRHSELRKRIEDVIDEKIPTDRELASEPFQCNYVDL